MVLRAKKTGLRCLFTWVVAIVSVMSVGVDAQQKGLTRAESQEVFSENENYAVIVGVNRYDYIGSLNYAVPDAERLAGIFEKQGYDVTLMTDFEADPERIMRQIRQAAKLATTNGRKNQGNIVFAFSGHGFQDSKGRNYLATGKTRMDELKQSALALDDITKGDSKAPSKRGLPIGNLTSQLFGNIYLNPLDHYVKEVMCVKGYLRYNPENITSMAEHK